jgi:hypothetical protein
MVPIYCKHCGKPTGSWKEAQDAAALYLQDHCRECVYVNIVPTEGGPLTIPVCGYGLLGCSMRSSG